MADTPETELNAITFDEEDDAEAARRLAQLIQRLIDHSEMFGYSRVIDILTLAKEEADRIAGERSGLTNLN